MKKLFLGSIVLLSMFLFFSCNESTSVSPPDNQSILSKATGPSASGKGTIIYENTDMRRIMTFSAITHPDGSVSGSATLVKVSSDASERQVIKLDIDCLNVNGNVAIMSGTVKNVVVNNVPGEQISDGWLFQFKVIDNGEGANAEPDQMTHMANWSPDDPAALACGDDVGWDLYTIIEGNIQVKP